MVLGKEVQYKEFMQIGDEAVAPNGVKVKLTDISGLATSSNYQPPVTFEVYDADGNKIDTATLQESGTNEYNKNGVVGPPVDRLSAVSAETTTPRSASTRTSSP